MGRKTSSAIPPKLTLRSTHLLPLRGRDVRVYLRLRAFFRRLRSVFRTRLCAAFHQPRLSEASLLCYSLHHRRFLRYLLYHKFALLSSGICEKSVFLKKKWLCNSTKKFLYVRISASLLRRWRAVGAPRVEYIRKCGCTLAEIYIKIFPKRLTNLLLGAILK